MTWLLPVLRMLLALVAGSGTALAFDADSGGNFLGAAGAGVSATWYGGTALSTTQTTASAFWTTDTAYTHCTGMIALGTDPKMGKEWDFSLGVSTPGSTVSCASAAADLSTLPCAPSRTPTKVALSMSMFRSQPHPACRSRQWQLTHHIIPVGSFTQCLARTPTVMRTLFLAVAEQSALLRSDTLVK